MSQRSTVFVLLAVVAPGVSAQPVYKSVDAEGNVTYSDTPGADAASVEAAPLLPAPSTEQVERARERIEREQRVGEELGQARQAREAARSKLEQERREQEERRRRQEAAESRDSEWAQGVWGLPLNYYPPYYTPWWRRHYRGPHRDRPATVPPRPIAPGIPGGGSPAPGLRHMPLGGLREP
jgi:hypothetical protein